MNKIVFSGFIQSKSVSMEAENFGDEALFLSNHMDQLAYLFSDFRNKKISLRYFISPNEIPVDSIATVAAKTAMGAVDCRYGAAYGSEWTGYMWTNDELNVGGHNLIREFNSFIGSFAVLEVEVHE